MGRLVLHLLFNFYSSCIPDFKETFSEPEHQLLIPFLTCPDVILAFLLPAAAHGAGPLPALPVGTLKVFTNKNNPVKKQLLEGEFSFFIAPLSSHCLLRWTTFPHILRTGCVNITEGCCRNR